jgi:hypothetical protein
MLARTDGSMDGRQLERFLALAVPEPNSGCWLWSGAANNKGYGQFVWCKGRLKLSHRAAYEHFVGPIPDGLVVDHLCRNTYCCNPQHLEPVTQHENWRRGEATWGHLVENHRNSAKTHCPKGHEYDSESRGKRICLTCLREKNKRLYAENPEYRAAMKERVNVWRRARAAARKANGCPPQTS